MNLIPLATITSGTDVELDLEDLSSILSRHTADGTPSISSSEAVIVIFSDGQTGTVALQEDLTGDADATRAYTATSDVDGNAVTTGALTTDTDFFMFQTKLARFINISTDVSAGKAKVFALIA